MSARNGRAKRRPPPPGGFPASDYREGERMPGLFLQRRSIAFAEATAKPGGPAKRPSYPMPTRKASES